MRILSIRNPGGIAERRIRFRRADAIRQLHSRNHGGGLHPPYARARNRNSSTSSAFVAHEQISRCMVPPAGSPGVTQG